MVVKVKEDRLEELNTCLGFEYSDNQYIYLLDLSITTNVKIVVDRDRVLHIVNITQNITLPSVVIALIMNLSQRGMLEEVYIEGLEDIL